MTTVHHLGAADVPLLRDMLSLFGQAFDERDEYRADRPAASYLRRLLASDSFIALAAQNDSEVVGAWAVYELLKFEQERSEIYIYDLAVTAAHRAKGLQRP